MACDREESGLTPVAPLLRTELPYSNIYNRKNIIQCLHVQQKNHTLMSTTEKKDSNNYNWKNTQISKTDTTYFNIFNRTNIIQLLTGFEDNSSFVWLENWSVALSRRLRATDLLEGQTKLLLFEKPVYNCFVIHLHFLKIFLFTLSTHISIRCFQYPLPSSPRIWTTPRHCDVNIMWLIEPIKIRPSVNSSIAGNRSMNCWPVNRTVCN